MLNTLITPVALVLALAASAAADDAAPMELKPYTSADGGYTVLLPPGVMTREQPTPLGASTKLAIALAGPSKDWVVVVSYTDMPADMTARQVKTALKNTTEGAKGKDGKVLAEKTATFGPGKLPTRDVTVEHPKSHYRVWATISGRRLYQVAFLGPKEFVASADADRVIASFQLNEE